MAETRVDDISFSFFVVSIVNIRMLIDIIELRDFFVQKITL